MDKKELDIGIYCKMKILERVRGRKKLAAAREKRIMRANKRRKIERKFIGTVIDAPNWEDVVRFIPANHSSLSSIKISKDK